MRPEAGVLPACCFNRGHFVTRQNYLFTSESVSEGHPDKVCDNGEKVINPCKVKSARLRGIRAIGYAQEGLHWKTAKIEVLRHGQTADIAGGVENAGDRQGEEGAGDQGIMFV